MNKINVWDILVAHVSTLTDYSTDKPDWSARLLFFGFPLVVACACVYFSWGLYLDALNALIAAFAIFAGLLLNLLLLIYTFSNSQAPVDLAKLRTQFTRELHANISFSVLESIAIVLVAFVAVVQLKVRDPRNESFLHTGPIVTSLLIYLTSSFVLTLLMILKRIHEVLRIELDHKKSPPATRLKAS
jgi:hypothetical protein